MEVYCRSCQLWEARAQDQTTACPRCGAPLARRRKASPRPSTHFRSVARSVLSMRGLLFVLFFGFFFFMAAFHLFFEMLAEVFLMVGATRLAWRAMAMEGDEIEFPLIEADDTVVSFAGFAIIFFIAPALLVIGTVAGLVPTTVAIPITLLLMLYAPIALVLLLCTSSTMGMFQIPKGFRLFRDDLQGYLGLTGLVFGSLATVFLLFLLWDRVSLPAGFVVYVVATPTLGLFVPFAFGLVGLYVRSKARILEVACDHDDWLFPSATTVVSHPPSPAVQPPTAPLELEPISVAPPPSAVPQPLAPMTVAAPHAPVPQPSGGLSGATPVDAAPLPTVTGELLSPPDAPLPLVTGTVLETPPSPEDGDTTLSSSQETATSQTATPQPNRDGDS